MVQKILLVVKEDVRVKTSVLKSTLKDKGLCCDYDMI